MARLIAAVRHGENALALGTKFGEHPARRGSPDPAVSAPYGSPHIPRKWREGFLRLRQVLGYKALDRLTSATVTGGFAPYTENYAYNATTGNLVSKGKTTLSYNDAAHVHAATAAGSNTYAYDANGNMTTRTVAGQTFTLAYDAEGHLVSVSGPSMSATFLYDGDGARVKSSPPLARRGSPDPAEIRPTGLLFVPIPSRTNVAQCAPTPSTILYRSMRVL